MHVPSIAIALSFVLLALLSLGCAASRPPAPNLPTGASLPCAGASEAAISLRYDEDFIRLSRALAAVDDREGFYAKRDLEVAATVRDDLLRVLLARDADLERCTPKGELRDATLAESAYWLEALEHGARVVDHKQVPVAVYDVRRVPHVFPVTTRTCDGKGLEGAAQCLVLGGFAIVVDIADLPAGAWLWLGVDKRETFTLADIHAPLDLEERVDAILRRRGRTPEPTRR